MGWTMLDHPGWHTELDIPARAVRTAHGTWLVHATPDGDLVATGGPGQAPPVDSHTATPLHETPAPQGLIRALEQLGTVHRLRNTDLWDALATAIIRQVIRAGQARKMHLALREAAGERSGVATLTPTPEQVLAMSAEAFTALGMAFKRKPLQAAAEAYLDLREEWTAMPGDVLVKALQTVPRIGPWTAGAAAADYTGDFSLYPYGDLAVRTWARRADPATEWPDSEPAFTAAWADMAGPHLSTLTVLTLAWGDQHANQPHRTDQGSSHH